MAVIVGNIRIPLGDRQEEAFSAARRLLRLPEDSIRNAFLVKASPDLRHRNSPAIVYTIGFELMDEMTEEAAVKAASSQSVSLRKPLTYSPVPGNEILPGRVVIAGFGPAGMFAGLMLARAGYHPLILERGADVDTRVADVEGFWNTGVLNTDSNVQFGEGGAGTFSDGKLTTRINDKLCDTVIKEFIRHGAPEDIKWTAKPHIGTDKLRSIVKSIRSDILRHGGEILFHTKLEAIHLSKGMVTGISMNNGMSQETGALILAIGHSARDTFEMLLKSGVILEPKPFSAGVRIEHLQSEIDRMLYGSLAGHPSLPKGEYQLSYKQGNRTVYTFCMCPGGTVVAAASEAGGVVTNGMSRYSRDGVNANAALAVSIDAFPSALEGIEFQRLLESRAFEAGGGAYKAPYQTVGAFYKNSSESKLGRVFPTYPNGVTPARLDQLFPEEMSAMMKAGLQAFNSKMKGFASDEALLTGVETRTSSPVRIIRSASFQAAGTEGLYPAGEGAGYAGGIVSAAVDGLRVASAVIEKFAPGK